MQFNMLMLLVLDKVPLFAVAKSNRLNVCRDFFTDNPLQPTRDITCCVDGHITHTHRHTHTELYSP